MQWKVCRQPFPIQHFDPRVELATMKTRGRAKLEAAALDSKLEKGSEEIIEEYITLDTVAKDANLVTGVSDDVPSHSSPGELSSGPIPEGQSSVRSLCSALDPGPTPDVYFSCDPDKVLQDLLAPRVALGGRREGGGEESVMKNCVITPDFERRECAPPITISKYARKKVAKVARDASTGSKWFDMPAPQLTPQLKNDLRLLRMRNALDPSQHYKANDSNKPPRYFQVGRVVADSADFYSSRIPRRQQKQTLVDELLANEQFQRYHHKKYLELQDKFSSGTKRRKNITLKKKFKKT